MQRPGRFSCLLACFDELVRHMGRRADCPKQFMGRIINLSYKNGVKNEFKATTNRTHYCNYRI
jgi:hypothetical protein